MLHLAGVEAAVLVYVNGHEVGYAEDSFTGYTAELSVDTAKSIVTQIVIRTANYTLTMTPA